MILLFVLAAQLHVATPVEELHPRTVFTSAVPAAPADFRAAAAKVFHVTARQFEFEITPAFNIEQGDSVTLNITADDTTHGFALEEYMIQGVTIETGKTVSISFVAHSPGTFTYFCTVFCGSGHGNMFGRLTVTAVTQSQPSITSFTPASAPVTGGTVIVIHGTDFHNDAVVKFGSAASVSTTFQSATRLTAITPAHAAGTVTITVTNPDGQVATAPTLFRFGDPPPPAKRRRAVRQ